MFCLSAITTHPLQRLRADSWHVAGAAWARGLACALLALLVPLSPAVAQPGAAPKPAETAATDNQTGERDITQWLTRIHEAARQRSYVGTFVVLSASGAMASSRIWHA